MHANLSKSFYIAYLLLALNKINNKMGNDGKFWFLTYMGIQ